MTTERPRRSVRLDADEAWDYVTEAHTGIFTTLRRDGAPVTLPVWFAVVQRLIYISTRGKKLARVRADSRASFLVESGDYWRDLKAVEFTGVASVVPEDELGVHAAVRAELDRKYDRFRSKGAAMSGQARAAYAAMPMTIVRFEPEARTLSWDNSRLLV